MNEDRILLGGLATVLSEELEKNKSGLTYVDAHVPDVWIDFQYEDFSNVKGMYERSDIKVTIDQLKAFLQKKGLTFEQFPRNVSNTEEFVEEMIEFVKSAEN